MNLLQRISTTVVARIDGAVRGIENHDAIVSASLAELRHAIAQARVRLQRIEAYRDQRRQRCEILRNQATKWRDRATQADDEAMGIECLRRAHAREAEIAALDHTDEQQRAVERRMAQALERLEQRYRELQSQRHTLRGREAIARASASADRTAGDAGDVLEETLERWAIAITEDELAADAMGGRDELAERFERAEQEAELRAELAALRAQSKESKS
ncbi:MAG: PspA/IM30 family protein [Nitrococcus sp.]|nr:PspA/IM30 family protein [Nitrococcus sp.]